MNFEQFQLPAFLIRDLYKESLVELNDIGITDKKRPLSDYTLGENGKKILILIHDKNSKIIADSDLTFLSDILNACKLKVSDVAILNIAQAQISDYKPLLEEYNPVTMLMFGIQPVSLSLPILFPDFQVQSYMNIRFLASPALNLLEGDKNLKIKLWACLQKLFL